MTEPVRSLRVFVGPAEDPELDDAVRTGGGTPVATSADADMVVWNGGPSVPPDLLHPGIRWVQLGAAGVEEWLRAGLIDDTRTWMSGAGIYSDVVAEHAVALLLALRHRLVECARANAWDASLHGRTLHGARVLVVGAGGIGSSVIRLLVAFGVSSIAVTRRGLPVPHADRTVTADALDGLWGDADVVVLAAPVTQASHRVIDAAALASMPPHTVIINIARGALIDTDALCLALGENRIGGAGLDVTDPEPLPTGHPLWSDPRVLITPHVANPPAERHDRLKQRVTENVARLVRGADPLGVVDVARGY